MKKAIKYNKFEYIIFRNLTMRKRGITKDSQNSDTNLIKHTLQTLGPSASNYSTHQPAVKD